MGKTLIKVDCVDQRLIVTSAPTLASGGKNEDYVDFNFCDKWDGFEKVAVFYRDINDPYKSTIDPTGRCVIPWEVLTSDGYIFIGAFGVKDDTTRTTEILKYKVKLGAITEDLKPSDPTPELWEQILARVADKVNVKQGAEHAGKVLGIDEEGNVAPVDGGSGAILDPTLSEANQAAEAKAVGEALAKKVDAVEGMGLSSNDYTDDDKLAVEQNKIDIEDLKTDLSAFEKNRPFNLTGNPVQVESFEGMPLNPITVLEPQQQGSGDPYPAGGGKNKLDTSGVAGKQDGLTFAVNADGSITINGTATASGARTVGVVTLADGSHVFSMRNNAALSGSATVFCEGASVDINLGYADASGVLSGGNTVTVKMWWNTDAVFNGFVMRLMIEAGSVATEYAPPSNIRPITGYDAVKLNHVGKNLLNNVRYYDNTHTDIRAQYDSPLLLKAGVTYTLSTNIKADGLYFVDASGEGNTDAEYLLKYAYQVASSEYTPTTDIRCIFIAIFNSGVPDGTTIQLEAGTATAHEPYQGNAYTVQIGQTVYGFRYEWLTGKGVIEWRGKKFDGTENWGIQTNANGLVRFWSHDDNLDVGYNENIWNTKMCSHAKETLNASDTYGASNLFAIYAAKDIYINLGFNNLDDFKAFLAAQNAAGTPVQISYKLAEPIEIQLEPHEINALQGMNTLYGDGEINVSGRTDMQTVVSHLLKRIAMLESKANETE